jgi:hypothetical protein
MKRFNLVIVHTPGDQDIADWQAIAAKIEASAPDIEVRIANNLLRNLFLRQWQATRPSLVFSASILRKFKPRAGKIHAGHAFSKAHEISRLSRAGVNVPPTTIWHRDLTCSPEVWGERVIVKPSRGKSGTGIALLPATRLHEYWHPITRGGALEFLVQRFVDTGPQPSHYRVLTGFGMPLYMIRQWAEPADGKRPSAPRDTRWRLTSNGDGHVDILRDEAVLSVARAMAAALGEVPVLGCDVIREESTGILYALEANGFGQTWHFSSDSQKRYVAETGIELDYYSQFDGLTLLANELVNRTRAEAG